MPTLPAALPAELWLQILEQNSIISAKHLWTTVRHVSPSLKDLVERAFASTYLPQYAISLSLPRRHPDSGALIWRHAIHNAQIVMVFDGVSSDGRYAVFVSPDAVMVENELKSVECLKETNVLPQKRLQEAPAWVFVNKNHMAGSSIKIPPGIDWHVERKVWVYKVEWKTLVSKFYGAKKPARITPRVPPSRHDRRNVGLNWARSS